MTIRSHDREVVRRQVGFRRDVGGWHFSCPDCSFWRDYATEQGLVNGAAAHMAQHGVRLALEAEVAERRRLAR